MDKLHFYPNLSRSLKSEEQLILDLPWFSCFNSKYILVASSYIWIGIIEGNEHNANFY